MADEKNDSIADFFQQISLPMWIYHIGSYRFLEVNEAAIRHYGYSKEEFLSMTIRDIRPPVEIPRLEVAVESLRDFSSLFSQGIYKHRKKNGETIDVEISAQIIYRSGEKCQLVLANDITVKTAITREMARTANRQQALEMDTAAQTTYEQELRLSEKRFKSLVQNGSDLIAILDNEGKYLFVSDSTRNILGIIPKDLIGKIAFDFVHPEDRDWTHAQFDLLAKRKQVVIEPFRFVDVRGEWRWLRAELTNMSDEPSVGGIVVNAKDVTDTVLKETALKESVDRISRQNDQLKEIAWIQSHVVRAPLARIMALTDLLIQKDSSREMDTDTIIGNIADSAKELDAIIRDITRRSDELTTNHLNDEEP